MGKVIITERQYEKIKNVLIFEQTTASYTTKSWNQFYNGSLIGARISIGFGSGVKFETTNDPLIVTAKNVEIKNWNDKNSKWESELKKKRVSFYCKKGKFFFEGNEAGYVSKKLSVQLVKNVCNKTAVLPNSNNESGSSYTQENDRIIVASDGKTLKISKGTAYVSKPEKNGLLFNLGGNKFGWFGCKSKTFIVDDVKYTDKDSVLANKLVAKSCTVQDLEKEVKTNNSVYSGDSDDSGDSEDQTPFNGEFIDFV